MLFAIIGVIFLIESIFLTVYAHKKKNGFLKYIGIVLSILIVSMIISSLINH
ncbi:hypothetical protein OZL92_21560 [Bacillus sonorensis]|uniref:hypothetical protein n=1 Tax=Bacillus TaxID=1386 RepID=UPI00034939BF|nr:MULTISPECIES: hypothetical protein [Bacillus]TWK74540.1 hypothetical protein CHCC20335_2954 [Bacillus paralicheniformis]MCF7616999.1 hypothetical protein [Bacillus sonorensis]MCY7858470.1 hypothetical protein [Bacillus sonorensis]MCY8024774.1 hypothetical protein [Bacillus sonorensis]MCY8035817.1 hypothetical protein [Bacillus sonorensis]